MTVENLKSSGITNLDASPIVRDTSGEGAAGILRQTNDFAVLSAAASVTSTYRIVRVPSNAKVKSVSLESEAQGAGKVNVSVYYSDGTADGTALANSGVIVPTTGDSFFASDVDLAAAVASTNVTNESGNYPLSKRNQPLWQALGLTADPFGFFDVVLVVHTTAITTGTGRTGLQVTYVE